MRKHKGISFVAILTLLFLGLPLVMIGVSAFGTESIITFPIKGFTFHWFNKLFASRSLMTALSTSLKLAVLASLIGLVFGFVTSYVLVKMNSKVSESLLSYFLSPSLIPGVVMGYALFNALTLMFRMPMAIALLIGHLLIVLPYNIRIIVSAIKALDESVEEAALSLGCKPIEAVMKSVLPNVRPALVAAFMMSFINSFNNLPVSLFLKGPGVNTLPGALMSYMEYNFDPTVSAMSLILMLGTLVLMIVIEKTVGLKEI